MRREFHLPGGFDITLIKRIPIAAGMAGGSADAAAVMRGIRDLMCGEVTDEKLEKLSLPLGADIPYCIQGGTKLCEGIGEVLTELPPMPDCFLVVVKPDIFVSTPWVYREYDSIPEDQIRHPDVDAMARAIRQEDLPAMAALCGNVLEQKTGAAYPVIGELEAFLLRQGAITSIMTGSGPTVFGIFTEQQAAFMNSVHSSTRFYLRFTGAAPPFSRILSIVRPSQPFFFGSALSTCPCAPLTSTM